MKAIIPILGGVAVLGIAGVAMASGKPATSKTIGGRGNSPGQPLDPSVTPLGGKKYSPQDMPTMRPPMWRGGVVSGSALYPEYIHEFYTLDPLDENAKAMVLDFLSLHADSAFKASGAVTKSTGEERDRYLTDLNNLKNWATGRCPRLVKLCQLTAEEVSGVPSVDPYFVGDVQYNCETIDFYSGPLPTALRCWSTAAWVLSHPGDATAIDACLKSGRYDPYEVLKGSLITMAVYIKGIQLKSMQNEVPSSREPSSGGDPRTWGPNGPNPPRMGGDPHSRGPARHPAPERGQTDPSRSPPNPARPSHPRTPARPPHPSAREPRSDPSTTAPTYSAPSHTHARVHYRGSLAYWQVKDGDGGFSTIAAKLGHDNWRDLRNENPGTSNPDSSIKGAPDLRIPASWGFDKQASGKERPSPGKPAKPRHNDSPTPGVWDPNNVPGDRQIPGDNVPPGMPTGDPDEPIAPSDEPEEHEHSGLKPGVKWDESTQSAHYQVQSGDYGFAQIASKIGPPGANWRDLRDVNPGTADSENHIVGSPNLRLPDAWVN